MTTDTNPLRVTWQKPSWPVISTTMYRAEREYEIECEFGRQYAEQLKRTPTPDAPEPMEDDE